MYRISVILPSTLKESDLALLSSGFEDLALANIALRVEKKEGAPWKLEFILDHNPSLEEFSARLYLQAELHNIEIDKLDWHAEPVEDKNWLEESYKQFPPFTVGPFFIYGSHYEGAVPDDQIGLQIDAATAFGSGEHPTTEGCLLALHDLSEAGLCPWNVLDMGTGSGILAIASWKLWKTQIFAVDNDAESIRVSNHHLALNDIKSSPSGLSCAVNEGFEGDLVKKRGPYELIIANILAGPLREMAADLYDHLDKNGVVVLSGILQTQAQDVLDTYLSHELKLNERYDIGEWSTLVLQNTAA